VFGGASGTPVNLVICATAPTTLYIAQAIGVHQSEMRLGAPDQGADEVKGSCPIRWGSTTLEIILTSSSRMLFVSEQAAGGVPSEAAQGRRRGWREPPLQRSKAEGASQLHGQAWLRRSLLAPFSLSPSPSESTVPRWFGCLATSEGDGVMAMN
jgi:hypothetical protein